ncbi:MAG: hypothetical protein PHE68_02905 [Candidatus Peribacteraceae bacterium]|nr:hypothetical protein [Candidatus Peribacteraceae bacterium]MDD5074818.1 hypothetical protein [Candidatus Peribacteraceae bacterium]
MNLKKLFYIVPIVAVALTGAGFLAFINGSPRLRHPESNTTRPDWATATSEELGIRFEYPIDASVSKREQRQTVDGISINEIIVTPKGMDPTSIHFFSTNESFERTKKIQIYQSSVSSSEFLNTTIDNHKAIKRIDHYANNNCTNELTFIESNGMVYGTHIVQCPTHPQGYDQLRREVASSLKF